MPDYKVTIDGCEPIPVRAANNIAARNHAVRQKVSVEQLTTEDAIEFGRKGVALQLAGEEAPVVVLEGEQEEDQEAGDLTSTTSEEPPAKKARKPETVEE